MITTRTHGAAPFRVAVVHGGPGAAGEMAPVARRLAPKRGVLEPIQTAASVEGQIEELSSTLRQRCEPPVVLLGYSWGAWLGLLAASRNPRLVAKLILVASGPLEERYAARLRANRMSRLTPEQRLEYESIRESLGNPREEDRDGLLARLGSLLGPATDSYAPVDEGGGSGGEVFCDGAIFQKVWTEAAELRRSGKLMLEAAAVQCPVVAVHGDYDPGPWEGVRDPLAARLRDFRFVLLERCGHKPWIERFAREEFFRIVEEELG